MIKLYKYIINLSLCLTSVHGVGQNEKSLGLKRKWIAISKREKEKRRWITLGLLKKWVSKNIITQMTPHNILIFYINDEGQNFKPLLL